MDYSRGPHAMAHGPDPVVEYFVFEMKWYKNPFYTPALSIKYIHEWSASQKLLWLMTSMNEDKFLGRKELLTYLNPVYFIVGFTQGNRKHEN